MWQTITAALRWIEQHEKGLGLIGAGLAAIAAAGWTVYLRWSDIRRRKTESPQLSGPAVAKSGAQASAREVARTSDPPTNPFRLRPIAEMLFRAIAGGVVGFLLVPFLFLYCGWSVALVFGVAFGFFGLLVGHAGDGFCLGIALGCFCFLTGLPGAFASDWVKSDNDLRDDARDGLVGALVGAVFGAIVLSCIARALQGAANPAKSLFGVAAAGALVGGMSGIVAAILPNRG